MAVEARHINLSPLQLMANRNFVKTQTNMNTTMCNNLMNFSVPMNTTATPDRVLPYGQSFVCDPIPSAKASESGLNYNVNPAPRKRSRDSLAGESDAFFPAAQRQKPSGFASLIDQDLISQIQQQQSEIVCFIAQHTEKLRLELEERRSRQTRMLTSVIQSAIAKKLKEKDDEIQRIGNLNWVLQERVKSLYVENQIWRDLAQTNDAAANNLRTNLEQVLAQAGDDHRAAADDDVNSSCGSCGGVGRDADDEIDSKDCGSRGEGRRFAAAGGRGCRKCGEREARVLVLPCRHLCLCTTCGSSSLLQTCPVCDTVMSASVHVNMS